MALLSSGILASTAAAAEEKPSAIEEVVVTARYREESAQDVPVALTAFTEDMLLKIAAQDLRDVGPASPNVRIQPVVTFQNSAAVNIRGMGGQGIESTEEMRVGISINGVFTSRPIATLTDLFDVEMVEVLRGPQGTTFGKNSLAGGINMTTKRPEGKWGFDGEVTGGNYGREDYRVAVEAPILENVLSARVAGLFQNYDGHFENRVNGDNLGGEGLDVIRGTLLYTPVESFDATFIYTYLNENSTAPGGEADNDPTQIMCVGFRWCGEPDTDEFTVGRDALEFADTDQDGGTVIMNWDVGIVTLTSVTGWADTDDFIASDFDQSEVPFFPTFRDQTHDQFSSELRAHSNFAEQSGFLQNLDLVVGLYYFEQEHELVQSFPTLGPSADYAHQEEDSWAAFSQAIYALNDKTNFTFGVRYTDESKDFERNSGTGFPVNAQNPNSRPSIAFMSTQVMNVTGNLDSDNTSIRTGVDYRFTDAIMAYAMYAQGFKAGEFGARASSNFTVGPTKDETSDSYEMGLKSTWLDDSLRLNVAAFYTTYSDLAFGVFIPSPNNPTGQETSAQSIGEATTYGVEFETLWLPIERLTLSMNLGLLNAEYDDFCADLDGPSAAVNPVSNCGGTVTALPNGTFLIDTDHTNLDLPRAPETDLYLAAEYELPTPVGPITARISTNYEDEFYTDGVTNNPKALTGDYWLWDSSITWNSNDGAWRMQAWCKNCTDETYVMGLTPTANFFNQKFWGNPQTYGLTLGYKL
jgi:iron complex outermembrane receptor protein